MRAGVAAALAGVLAVVVAGCDGETRPPVVDASEVETSALASPSVDPDEAKLAELRATDQFDEFAEHERAAKADGARLAWENFAPIVDGERVEWTNKAELWDSIAPEIRDEALLLGPEYRKPLWNNTNAIPNAAGVPWTFEQTGGRGWYAEFVATYEGQHGPTERVWGFLIATGKDSTAEVVGTMPPADFAERDYPDAATEYDVLQERAWAWIEEQPTP